MENHKVKKFDWITSLLGLWLVGALALIGALLYHQDVKWDQYTKAHHCVLVETTTNDNGQHGSAWVCPKE